MGEIDAVQTEPQGVGQRVGNDQQQYQYHGSKHRHTQGALRELTAVHTRGTWCLPPAQGRCTATCTEGREGHWHISRAPRYGVAVALFTSLAAACIASLGLTW